MARTLRVGVSGSTGRLGSLALRLVEEADDLEAVAVDARQGLDLAGLDVLFDATVLEASERIVDAAVAAGVPVVVGTSGWSEGRWRAEWNRESAYMTHVDIRCELAAPAPLGTTLDVSWA